jgi:hypothetical protein
MLRASDVHGPDGRADPIRGATGLQPPRLVVADEGLWVSWMPLRWVEPDDAALSSKLAALPRVRLRSRSIAVPDEGRRRAVLGQTVNIADVSLQRERRRVTPIMNVALTGATGFIGSHVLAELQSTATR